MDLENILIELTYDEIIGPREVGFDNLSFDSRNVDVNSMFFAIRGWTQDGHDYIHQATENGCKILVVDREVQLVKGCTILRVPCTSTALSHVASIFYQGLDRSSEGIESAEKAVIAYGGVQMGQLEKNVSWISLFIALAPMLGFMGTVIGMIQAFDKIEAAGDMQPSLVAGGIKVALLTTVFGLIVAIILQIFYNYIIAKIDSIVNDMENASIDLMDILVNNKK